MKFTSIVVIAALTFSGSNTVSAFLVPSAGRGTVQSGSRSYPTTVLFSSAVEKESTSTSATNDIVDEDEKNASASVATPAISYDNKAEGTITMTEAAAEEEEKSNPEPAKSEKVKEEAIAFETSKAVSVTNNDVSLETAVSTSSLSSVDKRRIKPGRYDMQEQSIAIPFLKRPTKLDGTHAGDLGFDPLGLTEEFDLYTMQEAEIRHARLAMLAVVGWPVSELLAPTWMLQDGGCAPSVLNGFNPISFVAVLAAFSAFGFFEYKTALRKTDDTKLGKIHEEDMAEVWKYGVAGDYDFDPLDLYESIGDNAYARKGLREVEISHGRMAMLGITSFAIWEVLTGHPIVENSMFFHPNALLPALAVAYFAFGQLLELDEDASDRFLRFKLSSEGEARIENLKMGLGVGRGGDSDGEDVSFDYEAVAEFPEKARKVASNIKKQIDKWQKGM